MTTSTWSIIVYPAAHSTITDFKPASCQTSPFAVVVCRIQGISWICLEEVRVCPEYMHKRLQPMLGPLTRAQRAYAPRHSKVREEQPAAPNLPAPGASDSMMQRQQPAAANLQIAGGSDRMVQHQQPVAPNPPAPGGSEPTSTPAFSSNAVPATTPAASQTSTLPRTGQPSTLPRQSSSSSVPTPLGGQQQAPQPTHSSVTPAKQTTGVPPITTQRLLTSPHLTVSPAGTSGGLGAQASHPPAYRPHPPLQQQSPLQPTPPPPHPQQQQQQPYPQQPQQQPPQQQQQQQQIPNQQQQLASPAAPFAPAASSTTAVRPNATAHGVTSLPPVTAGHNPTSSSQPTVAPPPFASPLVTPGLHGHPGSQAPAMASFGNIASSVGSGQRLSGQPPSIPPLTSLPAACGTMPQGTTGAQAQPPPPPSVKSTQALLHQMPPHTYHQLPPPPPPPPPLVQPTGCSPALQPTQPHTVPLPPSHYTPQQPGPPPLPPPPLSVTEPPGPMAGPVASAPPCMPSGAYTQQRPPPVQVVQPLAPSGQVQALPGKPVT